MIKTDCHLHSTFSTDGISDMEAEIKRAIDLHLEAICFTEHNDYGANPDGSFVVDTPVYRKRFFELKEKYSDRIELLYGIEAGLQPFDDIISHFVDYLPSEPFDFIIGSSHVVRRKDPYFPEFYNDYPDDDSAYRAYFEEELENVRLYGSLYDSYGHLDYILRYGKTKNKFFTYDKFADILEPLLKAIVEAGRCLEVNSAGFRKGMGEPNPHHDILKRYHDLGGLPPTIGSDAHEAKDMTADFDRAEEVIKAAGFTSYSIFRKRKRSEIPLQTEDP